MICTKASLVLYFERNGRLNFAKIVLDCAKPVGTEIMSSAQLYGKPLEKSPALKAGFLPSFDVMAEVAGVYILEMSNRILIKCCT